MAQTMLPSRGSAYLAELFAAGGQSPHDWSNDDLAEMMRHQLRAPLTVDLLSAFGSKDEKIRQVCRAGPVALESVGDLLAHPDPPIELLKRLKEFAKNADAEPHLLPQPVAVALYYIAIAVALVHGGQVITELPDDLLRSGLEWAGGCVWIGDNLQKMCCTAAQMLRELRPTKK